MHRADAAGYPTLTPTSDETRARPRVPDGRPSARPNDPDLPTRIGRFQIKSLLGEGAYERVFLGFDAELNRLVAIEIPKFVSMTDALALRPLPARGPRHRENRAPERLPHPSRKSAPTANCRSS